MWYFCPHVSPQDGRGNVVLFSSLRAACTVQMEVFFQLLDASLDHLLGSGR